MKLCLVLLAALAVVVAAQFLAFGEVGFVDCAVGGDAAATDVGCGR